MSAAPRTAQGRPAGRLQPVAQQQAAFALEPPEAPPPRPLDVVAITGQTRAPGTRRVLLKACPLPMPPSMNDYWHTRVIVPKEGDPFSHTYLSEKARAYKDHLRDFMLERKCWFRSENPVALRVLVCWRDEREQDLDNRIKPLQDALVHANVIVSDRQVKQLEVRQGPNLKPPVCYVTLVEILPDRIANREWITSPLA